MIKTIKNRAFTLIELLVVIAIIGILAALIIVSLTGARSKATDTQLKNNLRNIDTALEQYYTDHAGAYVTEAAQVDVDTLSGDLADYIATTSSAYTFTGVTTGYISLAAGAKFLAATGLKSVSEAATSIAGNGIRLTNMGAGGAGVQCATNTLVPGTVCQNLDATDSLAVAGIGLDANPFVANDEGKAFVVYGPQ